MSVALGSRLIIPRIRSFDNARSEFIYFQTPLTLIVGDNGSGKTTVIECLKYASTGQLPPNSKGGAFVHEPKLCGEKEVLGQVKLQFKDAKKSKLVVTRSLMLSVKKASRSSTTLDCNFLMIRDGERTNISKKVAEMDKIVPKYLGVAPAILESVIFCHQDESLWPMSEPSALKKKFDEIFEALKYTKAIDQLKSLKKTQMDEMRVMKVQEDNARVLKDKADKCTKRATALQSEIDKFHVQLAELEKKVAVAATDKQEKQIRAQKALGLVDELKSKTDQAKYIQRNVNELKGHLKELGESDEWLETTLAQYDERMAGLMEEEETLRVQYTELNDASKAAIKQLSKMQSEKGQHLAEKASYEGHLESRIQLVREAARQHSLRGYDGDLEDEQICEFVSRVDKLYRDKDRELELIRKKTDDELEKKQGVLTGLELSRTTRTQEKVTARNTIASNDKKSATKHNELKYIKMDEGSMAALESSLTDVKERLDVLRLKYEEASWDTNIKAERNRLREYQDEASRLRTELVQSNKLANEQASLQHAKKESKDRQQRLDTMKATYDDQIASVVGDNWKVENLEREFQRAMDDRARAVTEAKKQQEGINRELSGIEFKLKTSRDTLKQKKSDMQKHKEAVMKSLSLSDGSALPSIDEYPKELAALEVERNEAQKELDGADYVIEYYKKGKVVINQHNSCELCARSFADSQEKASALERLNKKLAKVAKATLAEELQKLDEDFQAANATHFQYETYKTLSSVEIPTLEKTVQNLESEKSTLVASLERQDTVVRDLTTTKEDGDCLSKAVGTITQYCGEISRFQSEITRLSSQQSLTGSFLSADEIDQQSTACEENIRLIQSKLNKLLSDKEQAISAITTLEKDESNYSRQVAAAKNQLEKKDQLSAQIKEYRDSNLEAREAIQIADAALESLAPDFAKAKAQYEDVQKRGRAEEKKVQYEKDEVAKTVHKFRVLETSIQKYLENNGDDKLAACERKISSIEQEQRNIETELVQATKKNNGVKARQADSESMRKTIEENIRYRKNAKELKKYQAEIAELKSRNVEEDYEELERQASYASKLHQNLEADRGPIVGEVKAKDHELSRYLDEWETDYKDAAAIYRENHLKLEVTKAACDDLSKYSGALDSAIMKYHTMKMEEINQIATELWQRTYQGTDVDTIQIRSEGETVKANRNYNYRVVMVKGDVEMDMRGRCSAGQKVLASIIIRLALAESFGVNCGVIALDEPTTNLDVDNINALALSLNAIIKTRRHQANFQLIIITHDEEFLKAMQPADFTDIFWKISRDGQQKSMIKRTDISALMD